MANSNFGRRRNYSPDAFISRHMGQSNPLRHFILASIAAASLIGCGPAAEVHYRVTVEVNDHGTIRSGSSVWAFALKKAIIPLASPYNPRFRGEAIRVLLPGRGAIFALVSSDLQAMYPEHLFGDLRRSPVGDPPIKRRFKNRTDDLKHIRTMVGAKADLECVDPSWIGLSCPKMVRFKNERDPKSVEVVDPAALSNIFGTGVKLERVFVEITDAPVTEGAIASLPSFGPETGFDEWYRSLPFGDPRQISKCDFKSCR